jgi:small subunit ribosomal protein S18
MAMQRRIIKKIRVLKNCPFCEKKVEPEYKETSILSKYMSERGKILGRARTGLCSKHQRRVTESIKHARHVALMPFVARM